MPRFWLNLQTNYDLELAEDENLAKIERDVRPIEVPAQRRKISLLTMLDAGAPAAALDYGVGRIGSLSNASGLERLLRSVNISIYTRYLTHPPVSGT